MTQLASLRFCAGVAILLATTLAGGCSTVPGTRFALHPGEWNVFRRREFQEERDFGPTFTDRVVAVRGLARRANSMTPEQRQRVSDDLAARLPEENNILMRREIVRALGDFPTPVALESLRTAANDPEVDVRIAACEGLGRQRSAAAAQVLAEVLGRDSDTDVRLAATRALGEIRDPAAMRALGLALDDTDPALQYRGVQSLAAITDRNYGSDLNAWRELARGGDPGPADRSLASGWIPWWR